MARYGLMRATTPPGGYHIPRGGGRRWRGGNWAGGGGSVLLGAVEEAGREGRQAGRQQLVCREQRLRLAS